MKKKIKECIASLIRLMLLIFVLFIVALPILVSKAEADDLFSQGSGYHPGCIPALICKDSVGNMYFISQDMLHSRGVIYGQDMALKSATVIDTNGHEHQFNENEKKSDHCMPACVSNPY